MEKETSPRLLQDLSTLIASLLPILQLFFAKLPEGITQIFQNPNSFTGISIVTLIISYVLIIAYQARPFFILTLPFQQKRSMRYQDYIRKVNEASATKNFTAGEQSSHAKIDVFLKKLTIKPEKPPIQITQNNIVLICVVIIFINAVCFIVIGQTYRPPNQLAIFQSINYILLISFTALVLTVYYRISQNNRRYEEDLKNKTRRAIDLATFANCFGPIPQVKLISSFEDQNVPSNYHVFVDYNKQKYEIITDFRAQKILGVYPY